MICLEISVRKVVSTVRLMPARLASYIVVEGQSLVGP